MPLNLKPKEKTIPNSIKINFGPKILRDRLQPTQRLAADQMHYVIGLSCIFIFHHQTELRVEYFAIFRHFSQHQRLL